MRPCCPLLFLLATCLNTAPLPAAALDFDAPVPGTLADTNGLGSGFIFRLPGTGFSLSTNDGNLNVSINPGRLTIKSTSANIDHQSNLGELEAPGIALHSFGTNDFTVSALFRNVRVPNGSDQLLVFVGTAATNVIRAGFHQTEVFIIVMNQGQGDEALFVSPIKAFTPGDDVSLSFGRLGNLWQLSWQNLTTPSKSGSSPLVSVPQLATTNAFAGVIAANAGTSIPFTAQLDNFSVSFDTTNDSFASRFQLIGAHVLDAASNANATKEVGEPIVQSNLGGKSLWWTWTAPQNGTVTIKTEGSGFDTTLGVFSGNSLTNLTLVASGDDSTGPDPLSSLVTFHCPSGAVYQVVVDGYRGDDDQVASGLARLSVDFTFDRYSIGLSVNDTNRGYIALNPPPDPDGKYLVGNSVSIEPRPFAGWQFNSWTNDLGGSNAPSVVVLNSDIDVKAIFSPIFSKTVNRSPSGVTRYYSMGNASENLHFRVWNSEPGTLEYEVLTDVDWLAVYPAGGSIREQVATHNLFIQGTHLPVGNHLGTILIRPLTEGAQPQSIVVALRIDPSVPNNQWSLYPDVPYALMGVIAPTLDGGFVVGDQAFNLRKYDARGTNLWQHSFPGGTSLRSILCLDDGGFLLGGISSSEPFSDKQSPHFGGSDFWIVRVDSSGNKIWDHSFGGTNNEALFAMCKTPDHGFALGGLSSSPAGGSKGSPNYGMDDFWVVKLDANGKRLWDRSYGGTNSEYISVFGLDTNNTILIAGFASSGSSGNKTNDGSGPWGVHVDLNGNTISEHMFRIPQFPALAKTTSDGGCISAGNGALLRTAPDGTLLWEANFALSANAVLTRVDELPNGEFETLWYYQFCCTYAQYFELIRVSAAGELRWRRTLKPDVRNAFSLVQPMPDGSYVFAGDGFRLEKTRYFPVLPDGRAVYSPFGFRLLAKGEVNQTIVSEYSSDLVSWLPFQTNLMRTTELEVYDQSATNDMVRFYRQVTR